MSILISETRDGRRIASNVIYNMDFQPGQEFINRRTQERLRLICHDEFLVFKQNWDFYNSEWRYQNTRGWRFYRTPKDYFLKTHDVYGDVLEDPTPDIIKWKPYAPMTLGRHREANWTSHAFGSKEDFVKVLHSKAIVLNDEIVLSEQEIYINPVSPNGRAYNGPLVSSENKNGFTELDFMFHAFNIQSERVKPDQEGIREYRYGPMCHGIGAYRDGVRSNKASYFLGSFEQYGY